MNAKNLFKMDPRIAKADVAQIKIAEKIYSTSNITMFITKDNRLYIYF